MFKTTRTIERIAIDRSKLLGFDQIPQANAAATESGDFTRARAEVRLTKVGSKDARLSEPDFKTD